MLLTCLRRKTSLLVCLLLSFLATNPLYADNINVTSSNLSAADMLLNIANQIPNLMRLATAIAYVMGMYFIFFGILRLKQYGEQRTMMSQEHTLKAPIIFMVIGTLLIYLPSTVEVGMSTFWGTPNPYQYDVQYDQWSEFAQACYLIVQLFGVIAFIRGLMTLTQLSSHGGHPGVFAKGITFIIAGIFCINIYLFVNVVMVTLGLSAS